MDRAGWWLRLRDAVTVDGASLSRDLGAALPRGSMEKCDERRSRRGDHGSKNHRRRRMMVTKDQMQEERMSHAARATEKR